MSGTTSFAGISATSLTVSGTTSLKGTSVTGTLNVINTTSAFADTVGLIVGGNNTGKRTRVMTDGIQAMNNTTASALYLNYWGGAVYLSSGIQIYANNGTFTTPKLTASTGLINSLTADDLHVTGKIKSYKWDIQHVANLGGTFLVTPSFTSSATTAQVTKVTNQTTYNLRISLTDADNIDSEIGGIAWTDNSTIKVAGKIKGVDIGTCDGTITSINTSSHTMIMEILTEADIPDISTTASSCAIEDFTVMITKVSGTNPIGIYMTADDPNDWPTANSTGKASISIYGGTAPATGMSATTPVVRIGNLAGLPAVNNSTPTGWGIYTNRGYFSGVIVSTSGKIGGWLLGADAIYSSTNNFYTANNMYFGASGLSLSNTFKVTAAGALTATGADITGAIKATSGTIGSNATAANRWQIGDRSIYYGNATPGNSTTTLVISTGTASTKSIGGSDTTSKNWMLSAGTGFGVTSAGVLYATGAHINGEITATSGTIGGASITDGVLKVTDANISGTISANHIQASGLTIAQSQVTGLTTDLESIQDTADTALNQSVEYIVGTQTGATGSWKGVTSESALVAGKTIAYKLPYAGSGNASLTLTLAGGTTTAAIAVYLNTTRVTTHFGAGSVIQMTYDGTYWRVTSIPNSDTYNRTLYSQNVIAGSAGYVGTHIICGSSTGYINIAAGASFDLSYPILYYATAATTTISSGSTANNHYLDISGVNFSINGTITSGAAYKQLYLKGTVSNNIFTISASPYMTTVEPTSDDGLCYLPLGIMSSATSGRFVSSSQLYAYRDGAFGPVSIREASEAAKTATNFLTFETANGLMIADQTNGTQTITGATGRNVLIDSNSVDIRNATTVLASFGTDVVIGENTNNKSRTEIKSTGIDFIHRKNNGSDEILAHIGYDTGNAETEGTTAVAPYYTFGIRNTTEGFGNYSFAEGSGAAAIGYGSHAEAVSTARGWNSHSEGGSTANGVGSHAEGSSYAGGDYSHSEGSGSRATGDRSHAEGLTTVASGEAAHAEGSGTTASGNHSHSEGSSTTASGIGSHAEGINTTASGDYSFVMGNRTEAASDYQTVIGKYNTIDSSDELAFIVGNGTGTSTSARSNAFTVDWSGNATVKGGLSTTNGISTANVTSTGSISASNFTVSGHASEIGNVVSGTATKNLANGTNMVKLADLHSLGLGTWIVTAGVRFTGNATGTRAIQIYKDGSGDGPGFASSNVAGSGLFSLECVSIVSSTSDMDIDLYARQNSGSAMSVTYYWSAVRIA